MQRIILSLLMMAVLAISCAPNSNEKALEGATDSAEPIGHITFHVEPSAGNPLSVMSFQTKAGAVLTTSASFTSVAAWNASTHTLSADVYIQSLDTVYNWDEPSMVISTISSMSSTAVITFQEVNAGTFTGTGGAGSTYAFADIQKSGSVPDWSVQKIAVFDQYDTPFNFTADLYATQTTGAVSPDRDHDGWNTETGAAGGDCNDNDSSKYPGGGTCSCGTTATSCDLCAATDNCCTISGQNAAGCGTGCSCTESLSGNTFSVVTCKASSVCAFTVSGKHKSTIGACNTGATCSMLCTSANSSCQIATCDGADCSITADGKTSGASIGDCKNGATCHINCAKGSTCSIACSDTTSSCSISNCFGTNAGTCTISCPSDFMTSCADGTLTCGSC